MNFRSLSFLLLFLVVVGANGNMKINPQNVESIEVVISRSGTVLSESGKFSNMNLILTMPQETYYQVVNIEGITDGEIIKKDESYLVNFKRTEPLSSFTYSYFSHVSTNRRIVDTLLNYKGGEEEFVKETEHILINDEIEKKAREITEGVESDLEKVALLAIWVNEEMEYDISYVGQNLNSIEVYGKKKGVCVEYTNLFLSMVRAIGIPGRGVTGYVYSPEYGWQLHSWAEVYLDKWVGVDPTWLEVANIDGTHIPLYFDKDTILKESISATTHGSAIKWLGKGSLGSNVGDIDIKSVKENIPKYKIINVLEEVNIGSEGTIIIEIEADNYMIFQANVNPCVFETEIVKLESNKITYFLSPGKNYIPINYKISEMLNSNNKYYCPVTISHTLGYDVVDIDVNGRRKSPSFDVYISNVNETDISFKVYSNDGLPIKILTNKNERVKEVEGSTMSEEIVVKKEGINKKNLIVYNEKSAKYYNMDELGGEGKEIIPTKIKFNDKIPNDIKSNIEIEFEFKNGDEITIMYYINGILVSTEKTMDRSYVFKKELNTNKLGKQKVTVKVSTYSEEFIYENEFEVFEPKINYEIFFINEEYSGIEVKGPVKEYKIYVNGKEIKNNKTKFDKGKNDIRVEWVDLGGYERVNTFTHDTDGLFAVISVIVILVGILVLYFCRENIMSWCKWK